MKKSTKSLKIDPILWKKVKVHCALVDESISTYIENLIKEDKKKWIKGNTKNIILKMHKL